MRSRPCFAACLLLTAAFASSAQQSDKIPEFEAVSVKPSHGADHGPPGSDGGPGTKYPEWYGANVTIRSLVARAYGLIDAEKQISGPSWIDGQKFAIDARVPTGTTREQFRKMLQRLLVERFGFVAHQETTVLPLLELTVAKNGPKLKAATGESEPPVFKRELGTDQLAHIKARQQTMAALAGNISGQYGAGRKVVDHTGLTGKYDFTLEYAFDLKDGGTPSPEVGLGIFEALQQQLGLKLVEAKHDVDRIVIDHVEKTPTEN